MDATGILTQNVDKTQLPPLHQKRVLAFVNHFLINSCGFLNDFALQCETKFIELERKLQKVEAALTIIEAKLASIPDVEKGAAQKEPNKDITTIVVTPVDTKVEDEPTVQQINDSIKGTKVSEHNTYKKFFKMLQVGVPAQAIKIKMQLEGLDTNMLEFISYFRLNKEAFCYVLDEIKDHLKKPVRMVAIPPILKMCAVLRFLADGSYQKCSGNDFNIGVAQSTMSLILKEVLPAIEHRICRKWIKTQMSEDEINASKVWFFEKSGFPGVLGCVDGTHVRIISPQKNIQHLYLNRKGYYSLNVMIMCDYNMNIRYVDARYPGANHDSLIFNLSDLKILGDAGYPLRPYLMTPFRMADGGSPQARYNTIHAKGRNIVERTIGIVKSKFRCLLSVRGLHYSPEKATQIVNVCCALHNVSLHFRVEFQADELSIENENITSQSLNTNTEDTEIGMSIRNNIMRSFQS